MAEARTVSAAEFMGNAMPVPSAAAYPSTADIGIELGGNSVIGADPWSTGIMAGSQLLGGAMGGSTKSSADSSFTTTLGFDNSGWNVSIGGGQITSDRTQTQPLASNWMVTAGLIVAGLIAWKLYLKK